MVHVGHGQGRWVATQELVYVGSGQGDYVQDEEPPKQTVLSVALVGETGNGKSSLGNNLVQAKVFEALDPDPDVFDPASTTKEVKESETKYKGKTIKIKDTMGLSDTDLAADRGQGDKSLYDGFKEIFYAISQQVSPSGDAGVDAFLWCVSRGKFTRNKAEELVLLKNIFGTGIVKHIILVITSGGSAPGLKFLSTTPALDKVRGELGATRITHSEIQASRQSGLSDTDVRNASRERVLDCVLRLKEDNGRKKYNTAEAMKDVDYLIGIVDSLTEDEHKDAAHTYFLEFLRGIKTLSEAEARIRALRVREDRQREEEDRQRMAGCQQTSARVGAAIGGVGGVALDVAVPAIAHGLVAVVWPVALAGGVFIAGRAVAGPVHRFANPAPQPLPPRGRSFPASNQVADDSS